MSIMVVGLLAVLMEVMFIFGGGLILGV